MLSKTELNEIKAESISFASKSLKSMVDKNTVAYGMITHVSRTGAEKTVRLLIPHNGAIVDVSFMVGLICNLSRDHKNGGIKIRGYNFCPIQEAVEYLAIAALGKGSKLEFVRL